MLLRLLLLAALVPIAACTATAPPAVPEPIPPIVTLPPSPVTADSTTIVEAPPRVAQAPAEILASLPSPETEATMDSMDSMAVDPLYAQTEDALRLAFTDGLFGLYRAEVDPADAQRLDREEIETWLTDLALVSPQAVEFARTMLGPVLEQRFVVGFLLKNAAQAECASMRGALYIPVPERFQGPDRSFSGYVVQDTCDLLPGDLAPFCFGGFGTSASGATCSCTCTTGEAPAQPCVRC